MGSFSIVKSMVLSILRQVNDSPYLLRQVIGDVFMNLGKILSVQYDKKNNYTVLFNTVFAARVC